MSNSFIQPLIKIPRVLESYFSRFNLRSSLRLIEKSKLFDENWYRIQYQDVAKSNTNPDSHYLLNGAREGRDPHPLFDTKWYLHRYPEVATSKINPLVHYLLHGTKNAYDPNPLFDTAWYLKQYPEVTDSSLTALEHYLTVGAYKNYDPGPYFSTKKYIERYSEIAEIPINPLAHYLRYGTAWYQTYLSPKNSQAANLRFNSVGTKKDNKKFLFVGHDASFTGAPVLLLNIISTLKQIHGIEPAIILLTDGPLEADYAHLGPTHIVARNYQTDGLYEHFKQLTLNLWNENYTSAFCNTTVTGKCSEILYQSGFVVISAIHEMSSVIQAMRLEDDCKIMAKYSHELVFPADSVREDFEKITGSLNGRGLINPQGLLSSPQINSEAKKQICSSLEISTDSILILAAGLGDLRKGLDLYLQLARHGAVKDSRLHFVWVGNLAAQLTVWFQKDMKAEPLNKNFHHIPFTNDLPIYYQAADVFVLPSREDPFPSVVLEALASGVPVAAFDKCGGFVDLLRDEQNGKLVPYGDISAMTEAILDISNNKTLMTAESKLQRSNYIIKNFDFSVYANKLLGLLKLAD